MRTTITLDADVANRITELMHERHASFKLIVNELLRRGLNDSTDAEPYVPQRFASGVRPDIDLDKALQLVAMLDDEEFVRKTETGK